MRAWRRIGAATLFSLLTVGPIVGAAAVSILGLVAAQSADPARSSSLRTWGIVVAAVTCVVLIVKAARDHQHQLNLADARYAALKELHNKLGPALDSTTEIALLEPDEKQARRLRVENVAALCCSALVTMTPTAVDARATVFELRPGNPDEVAPIAHFGRKEPPRTFRGDTTEGTEVLSYLSSSSLKSERYTDTLRKAPPTYQGDTARYRTFIRTPIYANNAVFGMLTVDAPKAKALTEGDLLLAELIASQMAVAFAVAAD